MVVINDSGCGPGAGPSLAHARAFDMMSFSLLALRPEVPGDDPAPWCRPIVPRPGEHPAVAQGRSPRACASCFSGLPRSARKMARALKARPALLQKQGGPGLRLTEGEARSPTFYPYPRRRPLKPGFAGCIVPQHRGEDRRRGGRRKRGSSVVKEGSCGIRPAAIMVRAILNPPAGATAGSIDPRGLVPHRPDVGYVGRGGLLPAIVDPHQGS